MQISTYEDDQIIFTFDIQDPFLVLTLLEHNKGKVTCKTCNETYRPDQLIPTFVGYGRSPFEIIDQQKGGIFRRLFRRNRIKRMGMSGGRGFECPKGHEVISVVTWII